MVRHSALTSMFKIIITLFTALVFVGIGGVTVSAGAHDCGCQEDNSGPGSTDSGSSGSGSSGSDSSGSSGPDNSGPGNACHDNSGPGSSGPDNSGPGNAGDDCPVDEPDDPDNPDDPGDSNNPGNGPSNSGGSGNSATSAGTVVLGAQASAPTQSGAAVPTAVNAGLTGGEESPSALAGLAILLGLAMTSVALVRRRTRV
jgi:hypothetical protein